MAAISVFRLARVIRRAVDGRPSVSLVGMGTQGAREHNDHQDGITGRVAARIAASHVGRWYAGVRVEARVRTVAWHWSTLLGTAAVACIIVLFVTGVLLMFLYEPSSQPTQYRGPWVALDGQAVSRAYASVMEMSLEVRGGLLLRQAHHWAALLLPALLIMQLVVTYVTGRHRRPRRTAWLLLCIVLGVALLGGWSGYALPDDMLAGSGLRIFQGILLSIPLVGTPLSSFLFGGEFPGRIIETLYPMHVGVVPIVLLAAVVARATLAWQLPGLRRASTKRVPWVRDVPLPAVVPRVVGFLFASAGVVVLVAATITVAPVWVAGPSDPGNATAGSQPDWYTGFLDGALRLVPPGWELQIPGATVSLAMLVPLAVVGLFVVAIVVVPLLEDWMLRDSRFHLRVDRPRDTPWRTGLAAAGIVFYLVLWGAASADVVAFVFHLALEHVILAFQIGLFLAPPVAYVVARRISGDLRVRDRKRLHHGVESGRIVRLPGGQYVEVHTDLDAEEKAVLSSALEEPCEPVDVEVPPPSTPAVRAVDAVGAYRPAASWRARAAQALRDASGPAR